MKNLNLKIEAGFRSLATWAMLGVCVSAFAQTATPPTAPSINLAQGTNATCQAAPPNVPPLYLRGGMNGWTAQEDFEFVWDCNAFFLNVNLQGEQEFKLADAKWQAGSSWAVPDRQMPTAMNT